MDHTLQDIPISEIKENPAALRAVNRQSESYLGLVDSIKQTGVLNAISVRQKTDAETGESYYELVDGLHRFSASKDAGLEVIPATVLSLDDAQVLEAQVMANVHKVETRPAEYSRQLRRILTMNPLMTEAELAQKLSKSPSWISDRLGLNKIVDENIADLINKSKINLSNAYALAKLPPEEQADFVDRAMTLSPDEFVPAVHARVKEIRDAKRSGADAGAAEFVPVAHLQKLKDIKDELDSGAICKALGAKDVKSFNLAIAWVLHLDPKSVEAQKAKDEERKAAREEAKKKKAAEKAEKKAQDLKEKGKEAADEAEKAKAALG